MKIVKGYVPEYLLIAATMLLSVLGFWKIYVGKSADPTSHQHLHVATVFAWLLLLLYQLDVARRRMYASHRKVGLAVLLLGPLLFATTSLLSVHSAQKGLESGEGDFLIVQNVMGTLVLGTLIVLAFVLRKRRKLHASFMLSTTILFMGIALFFTLISFVPRYRIEGPETFHRFAAAAIAGQGICLAVGVLFFARDFRNGWPFLLAALSFPLNEVIRSSLVANALMQPLTEVVGSMSQPFTFVGSFALLLALLAATGMIGARRGRGVRNVEGEPPVLERVQEA